MRSSPYKQQKTLTINNITGVGVSGVVVSFFLQFFCDSNVSAATMTLTMPSSISLDVEPDSTLKKSSASTFSAETDGAWGYSLSIKAKTVIDMTNGSSRLSAIPKTMTEDEYATLGNNNTWGFLPNKLDGLANTNFIAATTSANTIDNTNTANAGSANDYTIILGAKADNAISSRTYSNTLVLTLAANSASYNITYDLNSGSWTGSSPQTGNTTSNSVNVSAVTPTRANYTFQGWCTASTSSASCSGTVIQPGGQLTLTSSNSSVTLWAIWKLKSGYAIHYELNSGSGGPSPNPQTGSKTSGSIKLSSIKPTRNGYNFVGWCKEESDGNTCAINRLTFEGSSYTLDSNNLDVKLYAIWHPRPSTCNTTGVRMRDGKCWSGSDVATNATSPTGYCSGVWKFPSQSDFNRLIRAYCPTAKYVESWGGHYWCGGASDKSTNDIIGIIGDWNGRGLYLSSTLVDGIYVKTSINTDPQAGGSHNTPAKVRCVSN